MCEKRKSNLLTLHKKLTFSLRISLLNVTNTAQKMKFASKDFFSKCELFRRKLRICSHLLKKSLMENFIFCAMKILSFLQVWSYLLEKHLMENFIFEEVPLINNKHIFLSAQVKQTLTIDNKNGMTLKL